MKRRWLKYSLIFFACVVFISLSSLSFQLYQLFYRPMSTAQTQPIIITIDKSTPAYAFVRMLKAKNFIKSERLLLHYIRMRGLAQQLKAGVYRLKEGESVAHFLHRVAIGDVIIESFRIIDGTTQAQISTSLEQAPYLTYHSLDWQAIAASHPNAEGLLLADTYYYNAGSQSKELLEHANKNLLQYLENSWQHRSSELPYKTSYELLTAASIIEKEAANAREKRLISGVIINRLRKNMMIQMDPTVIYALGERYKGKLSHNDLQVDSPYNTYRYKGLPPTPITMVGKDAIDAAAHPEVTAYLYFVATGDGGHYFSENYEQQKKAISRYLKK